MQAHKTLGKLFAFIILDQTALTLTFPLLTLIFFDSQTRLFNPHASLAERSFYYGLCISIPNLINLFFAPLLSALSDTLGRKKILLIEIFSLSLFTSLVGLGTYFGNLVCIFCGYTIKGAFSRSNPTALTIIGDTVTPSKKLLYMGYLQFAISLGAAIGPLLGGYTSTLGFKSFNFASGFFIAALVASLNTIAILCLMPETLPTSTRNTKHFNLNAIRQVLNQKQVLWIGFILLLLQFSWSMYYQYAPPLLKHYYHLQGKQLGLFISLIAVWLALASGFFIPLLQRFFTLSNILIAAIWSMFTGYALNLIALSPLLPQAQGLHFIAAIPLACGDVIAYSCLMALFSNAVSPTQQGKVMGFSYIIIGGMWALSGFLGGMVMRLSPSAPFVLGPVGIIIALIAFSLMASKSEGPAYGTIVEEQPRRITH
jgi:MFS family permease